MHSDFASLVILLLGRAMLATWPTEVKAVLQVLAPNPINAERSNTNSSMDPSWIEAGNELEFLIAPMTINSPNLSTAKDTCKALDSKSALFYTDVAPQGTDILMDQFEEIDDGTPLEFMIDQNTQLGQCIFIRREGLSPIIEDL